MGLHPTVPGAGAPRAVPDARGQLRGPGGEDGWWCFASAVQRLLWGWAVPAQQPPARRVVTAKGAQTLPEGRHLGGYWAAPLSAPP